MKPLHLVQTLNAVAMALVGGAVVVNATYPDVVRELVGKVPPVIGAALMFAFGVAVHLGLKQAKDAERS